MRKPTKADLEEQNAKLADENFALTMPLAYNLDLASHRVHVVEVLDVHNAQSDKVLALVEVFHFLPWRADGGYVWLRERQQPEDTRPRSSRFHITAMNACDFSRFCDERASIGEFYWREAQYTVQRRIAEAADYTAEVSS